MKRRRAAVPAASQAISGPGLKHANVQRLDNHPRRVLHALSNGEHLEDIVRPHEGLISRRIFADPEIFALEQERIFGRAWFFVGHESEIPNPGDVSAMRLDPVLFLRDQDGVSARVPELVPASRHAPAATDRDKLGFALPIPRMEYGTNGELLAASGEQHYGEGGLDKAQLGLIPVARLGSYRGIVFGTWDPRAPSLEDWLGDMRWYMDIIFGRTGEIESSASRRSGTSTRWKFAADNFTDNFHVFPAHQSLVELECCRRDPDFARTATWSRCENGHILHSCRARPIERSGAPAAAGTRPRFDRNLNPAQAGSRLRMVQRGHDVAEFSWLQLTTAGDMQAEPIGILNFRLGTRWARRAPACLRGWQSTRTLGRLPQGLVRDLRTHVRPRRHIRAGRHGELGGVHGGGARSRGQALHAASRDGPVPGDGADWPGPRHVLSRQLRRDDAARVVRGMAAPDDAPPMARRVSPPAIAPPWIEAAGVRAAHSTARSSSSCIGKRGCSTAIAIPVARAVTDDMVYQMPVRMTQYRRKAPAFDDGVLHRELQSLRTRVRRLRPYAWAETPRRERGTTSATCWLRPGLTTASCGGDEFHRHANSR